MLKTVAIYITYQPNIDLLKKSIYGLISQVNQIIIVDNTPNREKMLETLKNDKIEIIYLEDNYGIAYAQNIGIKRVLEDGADYILLSDQDTIYPSKYVEKMVECFKDNKVCAAGPLFIDAQTGKVQYFIKKGLNGFKKIYPKSGKNEVFQLIASGTIINVSYINEIGLMKEELFIDWVDMEWCWRALKKGYKIIGNADVVIEHFHGENSKRILTKNITLKSSVRYYYTIRNGVYLALHVNVLNIYRRAILFFKTFRNIFLFPIFSHNPLLDLRYTLKGFYHGLIGRLGKLDKDH
ncbi:MAG: glycosyltransferase family 2 protein [Spirochaetota bacterium]